MSTVVAEALKLTRRGRRDDRAPRGRQARRPRAAGTAEAHLGLELALDRTISGRAFTSGNVMVCDDAETDPRVDLEACRRLGARSLVVVPLPGENQAAGVARRLLGGARRVHPADARALSAPPR